MIGKPAVPGGEQPGDAGQFGGGVHRPGPPDSAGKMDDGVRAAVNFSFAGGHAHFAEQFRVRQIEERLHARILQGGKAEAALFEGAAEAVDHRDAHGAVAVEENPAALGVTSFCISHF